MRELAPVALFAYKRPDHLRRTLESLRHNHLAKRTEVIVFCDGPRSERDVEAVSATREVARSAMGFHSIEIVTSPENRGLANSVIAGVDEVVSRRGRVIVLEDDMETSPWFLTYMNDALDAYTDRAEVGSIHGYVPPIDGLPDFFFMRGADCWGWATWADRWRLFDPDSLRLLKRLHDEGLMRAFNAYGFQPLFLLVKQALGEIDSWYICWHTALFLAGKFTLHPGHSLVLNIGTDGSGTHGDETQALIPVLTNSYTPPKLVPIHEDTAVLARMNSWYSRNIVECLRRMAKAFLTWIGLFRLRRKMKL